MSKTTARERVAFATTLLAGGAFLVGAVRIWDVPLERVWGFLGLSLIFLLAIMGVALGVVAVRALWHWAKSKMTKDRQ